MTCEKVLAVFRDYLAEDDSCEITGSYQSTVLVRGRANIHDAVFDSDLIIANGLGEKSLDLNNITVKGRLVVWGGSAVSINGKSTVAGVVLPRNDGPVQVIFDAEATELSEKGCSIVKPSTMDRSSKVLFTDNRQGRQAYYYLWPPGVSVCRGFLHCENYPHRCGCRHLGTDP